MSELINNSLRRKELLKHLILQLHDGKAPEEVRQSLTRLLGQVPYHEVVEVEQELIDGGLPIADVLKLCDVHGAALKGQIDTSAVKPVPAGHPVDVFRKENRALEWELEAVRADLRALDAAAAAGADPSTGPGAGASDAWGRIRGHLNALWDVDKHYARKENLLFPFLEKRGITGPPTVMWGKHDEARALLKAALAEPAAGTIVPALDAIEGMIDKEEQIKAGRQERAAFWIPMHGRFLSIEYFALRGTDGSYLGTLEVSQDLTEKRALEGERRILAYDSEA